MEPLVEHETRKFFRFPKSWASLLFLTRDANMTISYAKVRQFFFILKSSTSPAIELKILYFIIVILLKMQE